MISVIVPVYNVEPYLKKCLDSVIDQTYRDIEILVIDDGSTDGCGRICDEYAERDERVKVFHTENRGLSCARNLGLDEAQGEWIGFVDSDDWIEPDMYECLLSRALETGADVVECGVFQDFKKKTIVWNRQDLVMSSEEAIRLLLRFELTNAVWNKIWKRKSFVDIRFPEDRIFEEHATTFRLFSAVKRICTISPNKYHYRQRADSLSKTYTLKNLTDFWKSNFERYESLKDTGPENDYQLKKCCAFAFSRAWAHYCDCDEDNDVIYAKSFDEMNIFARENYPLFGHKGWNMKLRCGIFFAHYNNQLSFRFAWGINRLFQPNHGYRLE